MAVRQGSWRCLSFVCVFSQCITHTKKLFNSLYWHRWLFCLGLFFFFCFCSWSWFQDSVVVRVWTRRSRDMLAAYRRYLPFLQVFSFRLWNENLDRETERKSFFCLRAFIEWTNQNWCVCARATRKTGSTRSTRSFFPHPQQHTPLR